MGSISRDSLNHPALTWAEIDLKALQHNYRELRRVTSPSADIMAVVKADGYGHGAVRVSRIALANGARFLAVARLNEAVQLRKAGIAAPILLFGCSLPAHVETLTSLNIWASIHSLAGARALSTKAAACLQPLRAHVKVDTGMGRLGVVADEIAPATPSKKALPDAVETIRALTRLPNIQIEGVYTHFASADSQDKTDALGQLKIFNHLLERLKKRGLAFTYRHAANSAATIEIPDAHLDLVRPGVSQYGLWPSPDVNRNLIDLKPVMAIKSRIVQVKNVGPGFKVSYGGTHVTRKPTRIATVPIGYADGYDRRLSSRGTMLVRGRRAPIVGRVCMDLTMLDVGHIPDADLDDEVVILGTQGNRSMTADDIADQVGTINYEIVSSLTARVPRVYRSGDDNPRTT